MQGCERFAFFAVLPLFVLYLHQHLRFTECAALLVLGVFLALSYLGALPGGLLVDRFFGRSIGTLVGCGLLLLGYVGLALDRPALLWLSLGLLLSGLSLFRPGLSALAGSLFPDGDLRRESGFIRLHFAVNVGALLGPLCGEWAREHRGFSGLFLCALLGMLAASITMALGAALPIERTQPAETSLPPSLREGTEPARIRTLWLLYGVSVIFWLTAQQASSSLALFAASHTALQLTVLRRQFALGPGHFAALHAFLVLCLTPVLLHGFGWLRRHNAEPSPFAKMIWGYLFTAMTFAVMGAAGLVGGDTGRVSPGWLGGCYILISLAELLVAPIGLSLVSKLAPPARTARFIGLWLGSVAAGNAVAGALGLLWNRLPHHRYFALLAALALGAALVLLMRLRRIDSAVAMNC